MAAEALAERYESVSFETVHQDFLPLLPAAPARVADIGAGTGRDAAALAARGYDVLAVEPVPELRRVARRLHPTPAIRWLADSLPALPGLAGETGFDAILLSAVWMHLAEEDRPPAMRRLHDLLAPGGRLFLSLRHGPPPTNRRMYDIPTHETVTLAEQHALRSIRLRDNGTDHLGRGDIHWTGLAFEKGHL
ncbi:SAM-dependent methyltransferase [Streptomyces sp. CB02923]|nr:SAM-dependent methyltransferase [Streptomyces sp. CB02923]